MKRIEELKELLKLVDMVNGFTMKGDSQDSYSNEESSVFDNYPSHCLQAIDEKDSPVYKKTTCAVFVRDTFENEENKGNSVLTLRGGNNERIR